MTAEKHENTMLQEKVELRDRVLCELENPVVLETCGGEGLIYLRCYSRFQGWVFEKEQSFVDILAEQRRGWSVFKGEAGKLLAAAPQYFDADLYDVDPYGSPWHIYQSLFVNGRFTKPRFHLVAHDGSRRFLSIGSSGANDQRWKKGLLLEICKEQGDRLETISQNYEAIAQTKLHELGENCGYRMVRWESFYTGHDGHSTHYWATFESG